MTKALTGQIFLVICCIFYMIWWYRGYRPNVIVDRVGGVNGVLLMLTAAFGIIGVILTLFPIPKMIPLMFSQKLAVMIGIAAYILLLIVTRYGFGRIVTTELFLIVGWTLLEMTLINRLYAGEFLQGRSFYLMSAVIVAAFIISMVLYVAYYRMEEMKAFYAAMVPLITEALSMTVLICTLLSRRK